MIAHISTKTENKSITLRMLFNIDNEELSQSFSQIPIAEPLYADSSITIPNHIGKYAYVLRGDFGKPFKLDVSHNYWSGFYQLHENPKGKLIKPDVNGNYTGVFNEFGPILITHVNEIKGSPEIKLTKITCN